MIAERRPLKVTLDGKRLDEVGIQEFLCFLMAKCEDAPHIDPKHDWKISAAYAASQTLDEIYTDIEHWLESNEEDDGNITQG